MFPLKPRNCGLACTGLEVVGCAQGQVDDFAQEQSAHLVNRCLGRMHNAIQARENIVADLGHGCQRTYYRTVRSWDVRLLPDVDMGPGLSSCSEHRSALAPTRGARTMCSADSAWCPRTIWLLYSRGMF